jgi:hypothetical protein
MRREKNGRLFSSRARESRMMVADVAAHDAPNSKISDHAGRRRFSGWNRLNGRVYLASAWSRKIGIERKTFSRVTL